ncbi:MAG: GDP-mannose 4,6-dehydratase [Gemmatimonadaceae bacterium]
MTRRALVTGGAGFIGSHVAELYLAEGYEVEIIDNLASGRRENLPAKAVFHEVDIASPEAAHIVQGGRFDVVSHLAAQIDVRKSVTDPAYDARVNIGGSLNLLEALRQAGRGRFIFSSTGGAIYGDFVPVPTVEDMPKDPESPYGIAKLSVEYYMGYFARVHGVETVALRYSNVYGPRQDPHGEAGVVAIFCNRILRGDAMTAFGNGQQTRDYVFVKDVARANLAAARAALAPMRQVDTRSYNIGTARETTVLQLADILRQAAGTNTPIQHAAARPGEQLRSTVNIDKARRELAWSPQVELADGLKETYAYFATRFAGGGA